ncbi:hypothetical protein MHYP_G00254860 [Metynnis hypsauchen]
MAGKMNEKRVRGYNNSLQGSEPSLTFQTTFSEENAPPRMKALLRSNLLSQKPRIAGTRSPCLHLHRLVQMVNSL